MRQVPETKAAASGCIFLGSGRLARHFSAYFDLLDKPYFSWSRSPLRNFNSLSLEKYPDPESRLKETVKFCQRVFVFLPDGEIEKFLEERSWLRSKSVIHFSGALVLKQVPSAHPLMTFAADLYDLKTYQSIPFIVEKGGADLREMIPEISNLSLPMNPDLKPLYHSFCVASGNFTSLLWAQVLEDFETKLNIPKETLFPYMKQVFQNLMKNHKSSLTGPISRGDQNTIENNIKALHGHPLKDIYTTFTRTYQ